MEQSRLKSPVLWAAVVAQVLVILLTLGVIGPNEDQLKWLTALAEQGNYAVWCRGSEAAEGLILDYLAGKVRRDA